MVMRKLLIIVALALAVGAAAPAASAWASPGHDQATGTGTLGQFGDPTTHVNAIQTPAGLKGGFTITYPDGTFAAGSATCLSVGGTTAYVTGRITSSSGPRQSANNWFPGSYIVIGVQDNGEPGTAGPDQLNFSPGFATDPGCGPNAAATPVFPIVTGNYRVFSAH
jgi:opacity protein-like surface antigen